MKYALIEIYYLQRLEEKKAITSFEQPINNEYDPVQQMEVDQRKHLVCIFCITTNASSIKSSEAFPKKRLP